MPIEPSSTFPMQNYPIYHEEASLRLNHRLRERLRYLKRNYNRKRDTSTGDDLQTVEVMSVAASVPTGIDFPASLRLPDRLEPAIIPEIM